MRTVIGILLVAFAFPLHAAEQKTREQKVREDKARVEAEGFWIYNDLPQAFERAKASGKPILVVLRCLPCEECVKLDDELVDQDPVIRPLLEKFVCVRQVSTNGLDLSLFQFDTDQSFAVFMLNADRTIYGRFGTRSHRTEWIGDVSLTGLAKALSGALELHANYSSVKASLAGKTGQPLEFKRPEDFPEHVGKFTDKLDYAGNVVQSCIHCHQIGDARRSYYRDKNEAIPDTVLFPAPHPRSLGLVLDPEEQATVKAVTSGTIAASAGFQEGDQLLSLNEQPLLSIADVQWALSRVAPSGDTVEFRIQRDGKESALTLKLEDGWRRLDDLSWRASTWGLRRMASGGLMLEPLSADERLKLGLKDDAMALQVQHVGQYGPHAAAKNAGFREGDILIEFDGHSDLLRETDLLLHGVTQRSAGDQVAVGVLRDGKRIELQLPMQK